MSVSHLRSHSRGRIIGALALTMVAGVLAACSGTPEPPAPTTDAAYTVEDGVKVYSDLDKLVAAAQEEGTLNIYLSPDFVPSIPDGFKAAYPWAEVNVTPISPVEAAQKWLLEYNSGVNNLDAGVMEPSQLLPFQSNGALDKIEVPNDSAAAESLQDATHATHPVVQLPIVIGYNTDQVTEPPASLTDLTDPIWAGKLVMPDPTLGSLGAYSLASLHDTLGGDAEWSAFIEDLAKNDPQIVPNGGASYQTVLRGDRSICICTYSDILSQDASAPVEADFYQDTEGGARVYPLVTFAPAKAPHPSMTALFINWLMDPAGGQKIFADGGRIPAVPVPGSTRELPDGVETTGVFTSGLLTDYFDNRDKYNAEFAKLQ